MTESKELITALKVELLEHLITRIYSEYKDIREKAEELRGQEYYDLPDEEKTTILINTTVSDIIDLIQTQISVIEY